MLCKKLDKNGWEPVILKVKCPYHLVEEVIEICLKCIKKSLQLQRIWITSSIKKNIQNMIQICRKILQYEIVEKLEGGNMIFLKS